MAPPAQYCAVDELELDGIAYRWHAQSSPRCAPRYVLRVATKSPSAIWPAEYLVPLEDRDGESNSALPVTADVILCARPGVVHRGCACVLIV